MSWRRNGSKQLALIARLMAALIISRRLGALSAASRRGISALSSALAARHRGAQSRRHHGEMAAARQLVARRRIARA